MGLETGTYISDLNQANPDGATDLKSEGDDHIRLIKKTILNTFPNISGVMSRTHTELNNAVDLAGGNVNFMLFQQTAAPTGWTKATTHNDKALRVVTGTVSNGGTDAFSTTFSAAKATESHILTEAEIPAHTHQQSGVNQSGSFGGNITSGTNTGTPVAHVPFTQSTGGGGGHTHDITMDLQYVDVIIASKD